MPKTHIAGLKVDAIGKSDLLGQLISRIKSDKKTWIITAYSEFLYAGLRDPQIMQILNKADFAVADGIGIFWAKKFLEIPLKVKNYWLMVLQACWQIKYSLAAIIFYPKWIKSALPEKIVGADLIWDLAKLAQENNLSVSLLGGRGQTPEIVKRQLISQYPNIPISFSNKNPADPTIIDDINNSQADILFVAYGPIKQEKWIAQNLEKLNVKVVMGVGGSFDYIAGAKSAPPKFIRYSGLEWLWRLVTQPHRLFRIMNATFGLAWLLWHYKVFTALPLRPNVVTAILNQENKILVCERNPKNFYVDVISTKDNLKKENYWQLPQGGIDNAEDLITAAKREAFEETGLKNLEVIKVSSKTNSYIWNNALRGFWKNRDKANIGQIQNIVYFKFLGEDSEIQIDGEEFINCKWIVLDELEKTVHPERQALSKLVTEDLIGSV